MAAKVKAKKETTLNEIGEALAFMIENMATKESHTETNGRIDEASRTIDEFRAETNANFVEVRGQLRMIEKRLDFLEEQGASNAGFAKEIDGLRAHIGAIRKHIGMPKTATA